MPGINYRLILKISFLILPLLLLLFANRQVPIWAMQFSESVQPITPVINGQVAAVTSDSGSYQADIKATADATAIPANQTIIATALDKRAYVLNEYFRINIAPLQGTGEIMVRKCLQYGAPKDCTIVAAIAKAETNLCKYHVSASYYNCWGFGGAGPNRIRFNGWEESIDRVYRSLAFSYGDRYIINPSLMERTFCGWEPGCTGWGKRVLYFVNEIDQLSQRLGMGSMIAMR